MEIKRKNRKGIKIEHNRKLFWIIILLVIVLIALIYYTVKEREVNEKMSFGEECLADEDCVPVCGCHPESCSPALERGECPRIFCTQVCSGPLDCNAGYCGCVQGKCQIVPNE